MMLYCLSLYLSLALTLPLYLGVFTLFFPSTHSSIHFALMVILSKNFVCPPLSYWGRVFTLICFSISRAHMNICEFRQ